MGLIEKTEAQKLLQDEALMDEIITAMLEDPDTIKDLASDVADKLSNSVEESLEFQDKMIISARADKNFEEKVIKEIIGNMG